MAISLGRVQVTSMSRTMHRHLPNSSTSTLKRSLQMRGPLLCAKSLSISSTSRIRLVLVSSRQRRLALPATLHPRCTLTLLHVWPVLLVITEVSPQLFLSLLQKLIKLAMMRLQSQTRILKTNQIFKAYLQSGSSSNSVPPQTHSSSPRPI